MVKTALMFKFLTVTDAKDHTSHTKQSIVHSPWSWMHQYQFACLRLSLSLVRPAASGRAQAIDAAPDVSRRRDWGPKIVVRAQAIPKRESI